MNRFFSARAIGGTVVAVSVAVSLGAFALPASAADPVVGRSTARSGITVSYSDELAQGLSNEWGSAPRDVAWILDRANRPMSSLTCQTGSGGAFYQLAQRSPSEFGFCWNGDDADTNWMPQGITTTHDALAANIYDDREAVAITWHNADDSSARLTLAPGRGYGYSNNNYRHILLVQPRMSAGLLNYSKVPCHAGGAVWYGRLLYVACTSQIRIFSFDYVHSADTSAFCASQVGIYYDGDARAYKRCGDAYAYVMLQVGTIGRVNADEVTFSTLSLDRLMVPDALVVGTYTEGGGGRVFRYDLDYTTRLPGRTIATDAFTTTFDRIQGATTRNAKMWFHSTGGTNPRLRYWHHETKVFSDRPGAYGAQSLSYWADASGPDRLYTLSEHPGNRAVVALEQAAFN